MTNKELSLSDKVRLQTNEEWLNDYTQQLENNMKAPQTQSSFEKHPEGQYAIICAQIIDTGTHWNEKLQKDVRKIRFMFLSTENLTEGEAAGKPFALFANFNFSMYQNSHLCQFIESWRGKKFANQAEADLFDTDKCLRKSAFATIAHNEQYVNINSIMPLPPTMVAPVISSDQKCFEFSLDAPNRETLGLISEKTQELIMSSNEWKYFVANEGQSEILQEESENPADF